jgi:DNA polymerase I
MILSGEPDENALQYVKDIINDLRSHKIPREKVVIATQLTKELESYEAIGPHVAIAQRMVGKDMNVAPGMIIRYIVCKGKGRIRDKAKLPDECEQEDYDHDYYINNQIVPAVDKIFEVLGYSKDDLLEHASQKKLEKFFGG